MNRYDIAEIKERLASPARIVTTTHQRPDGDAMGTSLGLAHFLRRMGHEVTVIAPTDYPPNLKWLPGTEDVIIGPEQPDETVEAIEKADIVFSLDYNDLKRIEPFDKAAANTSGVKIMIDHHMYPKDFYDLAYWDDTASSAAEMVYRLIMEMGKGDLIDLDIATCLYTGVMTDTGSFRFPNTTPAVHQMAAHLMKVGIKASDIQEQVFNNDSEKRLRLIGHCLTNRLEVLPFYHTAYITITKEDVEKFSVGTGDTEGLVNYPLSLQGIRFAVLMIEKDGMVKMSFRSRGNFAANEFAKNFNGGGHFHAAGGRSLESMEDTQKKFLELVTASITELKGI